MNLKRFKKIVETWGSDPTRWPDDLRASALEFMSTEPDAYDAMIEAKSFDRLLDGYRLCETQLDPLRLAIEKRVSVGQYLAPIDQIIGWLFPRSGSLRTALRPLGMSCLLLISGIVLGYLGSSGDDVTLDEEIALLAGAMQPEQLYLLEQQP